MFTALCIALIMSGADSNSQPAPPETLIIAHRGASAYLPEHTLEAYLLAYGQGADFIEPDLVMTADGHLVALHDLTLNATSNVAERYPGRARSDGLFYAIDFSLQELRTLRMSERIEPDGQARYPKRWPPHLGDFRIVAFEDLIIQIKELNRLTGRRVGLYPETKFPAFHSAAGMDIAKVLVETLIRHGLPDRNLPTFIQSFEPEPLERIRLDYGDRFMLIQLIGRNDWQMNSVDYSAMTTRAGLERVSGYADGIGPPLITLLDGANDHSPQPSQLLQTARELELAVHPFTFRQEDLPNGYSLQALLQLFIHDFHIEGVFTDHPDQALQARQLSR